MRERGLDAGAVAEVSLVPGLGEGAAEAAAVLLHGGEGAVQLIGSERRGVGGGGHEADLGVRVLKAT